MSDRHQAPRGTFDQLPAGSAGRAWVLETFARTVSLAGYGRIETPVFEHTEVFSRAVGESTDIVRKEMFTFTDQADRSMTLRPEGTAAVCRAYVEHGMHKLAQPVKLWYAGPFFRHEAPQAGRYRQFHQVGAEGIGSEEPQLDVELIVTLADALAALGVPGTVLRLSSLGSQTTRAEYLAELSSYLREHKGDLAPEVRERIDANPLRAFDSADAGTAAVMANAPRLIDRLAKADSDHLAEVRDGLDRAGVAYELDGTLVRGLDYYTRTVFEFACDRLGSQSGIGGGGRYDGLVELLGGPATPAAGWAAGIERILIALELGEQPPSVEVFVAVADDQARGEALALAIELRRAGVAADLDLAGRGMKGQMKAAHRLEATRTLIVAVDGSVEVRDMESGEQRPIARESVVSALTA